VGAELAMGVEDLFKPYCGGARHDDNS
jgi:hypothetical protein